MKNLETHIRVDCKWCGYLNHLTIPVLGKDSNYNHRCDNCDKYMLEMHTQEAEE